MPQTEVRPVRLEGWVLEPTSVATEETFVRPVPSGLVEELLLASLTEGGYPIPPRRQLAAGLAACAVVELAFRERVAVDGPRLLVTDKRPTGEGIVDPVLETLAVRRRAAQVERCVEELALDWTILGRAAGRLEACGLVRIERRALHPLIMHRFHPQPPGRPAERRARLRSVLGGTSRGAPREAALAALAGATGLLRIGRGGFSDVETELDSAARALGPTAAAEVLAAVHPTLAACGRRRPEGQTGCAGTAPRLVLE